MFPEEKRAKKSQLAFCDPIKLDKNDAAWLNFDYNWTVTITVENE